MSLQINLLPEYGWSIKGQTVYGPGSVFQGSVKVKLLPEQLLIADKLRIVFHASEATFHSGYITPTYKNQLFGTQKVLWRSKDTGTPSVLSSGEEVSIPFIVQIPMVQFPPSVDICSDDSRLSYRTNFSLTAYLDSTQGTNILKTTKPIIYMPFIETSLSKKPIMITTLDNTSAHSTNAERQASITASLHALDHIPGDQISFSLLFHNITKKSVESVTIKLYQIQTWSAALGNKKEIKSEKKTKQLVSEKDIPFVENHNDEYIQAPVNISLDIPIETAPTFTYGVVFSISYVLNIFIQRKGKLWPYTLKLTEIPIRIGTLGYGIKPSEELKVYSVFNSVFDQKSIADRLPVPKFLDVVEYEDSLPIYVDDRLPSYDNIANVSH